MGYGISIKNNNLIDLDQEKKMKAKSQIDFQNLEIFEFKIILIGEPGVGKTSIMSKFISNEFKGSYQSTLGVEFKSKELYINIFFMAKLKFGIFVGKKDLEL